MNHPLTLTDEQFASLEEGDPREAVPVVAPDSKAKYLLVRIDTFVERPLDMSPFDPAEGYALAMKVFADHGWADPAMDVYNQFAPRQKT